MTLRVDFTSQDFFREPAAAVERLRAAGPVVEARLPIFGRVWMTTTQEMGSRVLKDNRVFTLRKDDGTVAGLRWWMPNILRAFAKSMLSVDEPDHTRLRGIVEEAFRRRAVLTWSRASVPSPTSSPASFFRKEVRRTSSHDTRESCRFQ